METNQRSQARRSYGWERRDGIRSDLIIPNPKLKLLDQVREVMRLKHYSIRTERSYCDWIRRYIRFHAMRSREDLSGAEPKIEQFLSDLAVNGHVSASTQNQAFNALLFLYREILHQTLENIQAVRADRPVRVPTVLTPDEVGRVIGAMSGTPQLVVKLLYGSGLRLLEGLRLRVKDLDFEMKQLTVRDGKGANYAKVGVMQRWRLGDRDDLSLSLSLAEGWGSRKAGEICEKPAVCGFRFDKATVQERLSSAAYGRQLPWHNSHRLRLRFVCAGIRRVGDTAPRFSR